MGKAHGYGSTSCIVLYSCILVAAADYSHMFNTPTVVETRANGTLRHDGEWFQDEPVRKHKKKKSRG